MKTKIQPINLKDHEVPSEEFGNEEVSGILELEKDDVVDQIHYKELRDGRIYLFGEINAPVSWSIIREIDYIVSTKKTKEINMVINSSGGCVFSGLAIVNSIRRARAKGIKVNGHVTGIAASMAAVILSSCDKRTAAKYSRVMIHEVSSFSGPSSATASESKEEVQELIAVDNMLSSLIAENIGMSVRDYKEMTRKVNLWLSASQAKKFGIIHEVKPF